MDVALTNVLEELSSTDILHDHEDITGSGDDLVELDDVRMTKQLQQLNLSTDLLLDIKTRRKGGEGWGGGEVGRGEGWEEGRGEGWGWKEGEGRSGK